MPQALIPAIHLQQLIHELLDPFTWSRREKNSSTGAWHMWRCPGFYPSQSIMWFNGRVGQAPK
jgi:hypothetical protein